MPRSAPMLAALLCFAAAATLAPADAAPGPKKAPSPAQEAGPPQPPHAWLFGTWTGGIFPAPPRLTAQACLSQPVVIFTRDIVLRATLTSELYSQRIVESARTSPGGAEFRFAQSATPAAGPLDVPAPSEQAGFGCAGGPDVLQVERRSDSEIAFPHCADFPYPLVRCPAR